MDLSNDEKKLLLAVIVRDLYHWTVMEVVGRLVPDGIKKVEMLRDLAVRLAKDLGYDKDKNKNYRELISTGLMELVPDDTLRSYAERHDPDEISNPTCQSIAKYFLKQRLDKK